MTAFEIHLNGQKVCTAGISKEGVFNAHVTWVKHVSGKSSSKKQEFTATCFSAAGLDTATNEHLLWEQAKPLKTGDEVLIKIIKAKSVDAPKSRRPAETKKDLVAKKKYVRRLAKELGWKIQTPE